MVAAKSGEEQSRRSRGAHDGPDRSRTPPTGPVCASNSDQASRGVVHPWARPLGRRRAVARLVDQPRVLEGGNAYGLIGGLLGGLPHRYGPPSPACGARPCVRRKSPQHRAQDISARFDVARQR